jgi:hypothetical protein
VSDYATYLREQFSLYHALFCYSKGRPCGCTRMWVRLVMQESYGGLGTEWTWKN